MGKNLVCCCDGTGNQFGDRHTNVVKLYSTLVNDPKVQVAYYDPGVGTFSARPMWTRFGNWMMRKIGFAIGVGIIQNIEDAYTFLMQNYEPGDRIYLFGFSRGAYTARALAGMIHKCGLLPRDNGNLLPYAMDMFRREFRSDIHQKFRETFSQPAPIHFLGLWDTVASVGWFWNPVSLPHTTNNPSVKVVRHAVAIDERRAFFRQNVWATTGPLAGQDVKEVWFAGAHGDVGGGYRDKNDSDEKLGSDLSRIALKWMLHEAVSHGMLVQESRFNAVVDFPNPPDYRQPKHDELRGWWRLAEYVPKKFFDGKSEKYVFRMNRGRRRTLKDGVVIHHSVKRRIDDRIDAITNFPTRYEIEPIADSTDSD